MGWNFPNEECPVKAKTRLSAGLQGHNIYRIDHQRCLLLRALRKCQGNVCHKDGGIKSAICYCFLTMRDPILLHLQTLENFYSLEHPSCNPDLSPYGYHL